MSNKLIKQNHSQIYEKIIHKKNFDVYVRAKRTGKVSKTAPKKTLYGSGKSPQTLENSGDAGVPLFFHKGDCPNGGTSASSTAPWDLPPQGGSFKEVISEKFLDDLVSKNVITAKDKNFLLKCIDECAAVMGTHSASRRIPVVGVAPRKFVLRFLGKEKLIMGFDTEWYTAPNTSADGKTVMARRGLSYQFHAECDGYEWDFVFLPKYGQRLSLGMMIHLIVSKFLAGRGYIHYENKSHIMNGYEQSRVMLVGHFIGVDISMCGDYLKLFDYTDMTNEERGKLGVLLSQIGTLSEKEEMELWLSRITHLIEKRKRGNNLIVSNKHCMFTIPKGYRVLNYKPHRSPNYFECRIELRDTMLLCDGKTALAELGDALGIPKLDTADFDVQDGYGKESNFYKENMDLLLENHHDFFLEYAIRDAEIAYLWYVKIRKELGDGVTISSIAARKVKSHIREQVKAEYGLNSVPPDWFDEYVRCYGYDEFGNRDYSLSPHSRRILANLPDEAYIGGRNECFTHGLIKGTTYDYDLRSAYAIAMISIPRVDYRKDCRTFSVGHIMELDDFEHPCQPGFGYVRFEFPAGTYLPCIPIKSPESKLQGTPVFPLASKGAKNKDRTVTDTCIACAPDIYAAVAAGAIVTVAEGGFTFAPLARDADGSLMTSYYGEAEKELVRMRAEMRKKYGEKSVEEMLYKLLCNSVYGKTGQGIHGRKVRNILLDRMDYVPASGITDSVEASTITAVVRMLLALIMDYVVGAGFRVHSVTTDGFITDFPQDRLNEIDAMLAAHSPDFQRIIDEVFGGGGMLESKHINYNGFFNIKTRGNIGFISWDGEPVFAKAGYCGDRDFRAMNKADQREYLLNLILDRNGSIDDEKNRMLSFNEVKKGNLKHLEKIYNDGSPKQLSMDMDAKRFLLPWQEAGVSLCVTKRFVVDDSYCEPQYYEEPFVVESSYGYFGTRPFNDMAEYEGYAVTWKNFIRRKGHCVKDADDYMAFTTTLRHGIPNANNREGEDTQGVRQWLALHFHYPKETVYGEYIAVMGLSRSDIADVVEDLFGIPQDKFFAIWKDAKRHDKHGGKRIDGKLARKYDRIVLDYLIGEDM